MFTSPSAATGGEIGDPLGIALGACVGIGAAAGADMGNREPSWGAGNEAYGDWWPKKPAPATLPFSTTLAGAGAAWTGATGAVLVGAEGITLLNSVDTDNACAMTPALDVSGTAWGFDSVALMVTSAVFPTEDVVGRFALIALTTSLISLGS